MTVSELSDYITRRKKKSQYLNEVKNDCTPFGYTLVGKASQCYFFENGLIKLKCPNLLNVLLPFFKLGSQL